MWNYRELIINLAIAELKIRYQNTILGFFWSLLNPLLMTLVLYFVFRSVFQQEQNFAVNLLTGLIVWRFFWSGSTSALYSITSKPNLVTKVFVPRQILVLSSVIAICISAVMELIILLPMIYISLHSLPITILLVPIVHLIYSVFIYGIGLFLAALYVYFRDLNQIWDVLTNMLFYGTPIIYPLSAVPQYLMPYYLFNPLTITITIYRNLLTEGKLPDPLFIGSLTVIAFLVYFIGNMIFEKLQRRFAEAI